MKKKYIMILGTKIRKHHLLFVIGAAAMLLAVGDIMKHSLMKTFGDAMIVPAIERILARVERAE